MLTRKRKAVLVIVAVGSAAVAIWAFGFRADPRTLRIQVETIRDEDGASHRRWTFTSGRRWASFGTGTRHGEHFVVLDPPGSFDGGAVRFLKEVTGQGADRIVYEIEATRSPGRSASGPGAVTIKRSLRGNAGGTPAFSNATTIPDPADNWRSQFRADQAEDARIPLPAKVRLGVVGGVPEVIEFR